MAKAIKPERLNYGDIIGLVTPASAPTDPKAIEQSKAFLEHLGFKTTLGQNIRRRCGFLAGSDRERAGDLMRMFTNPKVKAILCVRGGYGTARVLPRLDNQIIRKNPKIFIGASDATAILCALRTRAGLVCFHGPMASSDFLKADCPAFTIQGLLKTVMSPLPAGSLVNCSGHSPRILSPGSATGELVGGNLSILCASLATPFAPSFKNKILFFEDVGEPPYRFDRMLTQLLNAGLLQQVAGIAIGVNRDCKDPQPVKSSHFRQTLEDVFKDRLLQLRIPVVSNLPFGHIPHNATLPLGIRAVLDANKADLLIAESAVK